MKRVADVPIEVLELEGHYYSTLDFCPPGAETFLNKTKNFQMLRHGWELAPSSDALRTAVVASSWGGASWLVLGDGSAYSLGLMPDLPKPAMQMGCWLGELDMERAKTKFYKGKPDNSRVLIRTAKRSTQEQNSCFAQKVATSLFKKRRFTDFVLVCSGHELPCHRAILAESSPVFDAALSTNMVESQQSRLEIQDAEPATVERMLSFIYTGVIQGTDRESGELLKLMTIADRYGLDKLVSLCLEPLLENLNAHSVVPVTRALKNHADHPLLGSFFQDLQAKVAANNELLLAVLQGV